MHYLYFTVNSGFNLYPQWDCFFSSRILLWPLFSFLINKWRQCFIHRCVPTKPDWDNTALCLPGGVSTSFKNRHPKQHMQFVSTWNDDLCSRGKIKIKNATFKNSYSSNSSLSLMTDAKGWIHTKQAVNSLHWVLRFPDTIKWL